MSAKLVHKTYKYQLDNHDSKNIVVAVFYSRTMLMHINELIHYRNVLYNGGLYIHRSLGDAINKYRQLSFYSYIDPQSQIQRIEI